MSGITTPPSACSADSCLRATPVAALAVHRTAIHHRDDASLTPDTRPAGLYIAQPPKAALSAEEGEALMRCKLER